MTKKDKLAMQVVEAMNCKETTQQVIKNMVDNMSKIGYISQMEKELLAQLPTPIEQIMTEVMEALEVDELIEVYSTSYAKIFTEEELEGILEVVSNPSYKLLMTKTTDILADNLDISQTWIQNRIPKVEAILAKYDMG